VQATTQRVERRRQDLQAKGMGLAYDVLEQNNLTKPLTCNDFSDFSDSFGTYMEILSH
jgi:hypothetical protein